MPMYNLTEHSDAYSIISREVYGNTIEMNQFQTLMMKLLVFLLIRIIVLHPKYSNSASYMMAKMMLKKWFDLKI